MIVSRRHHRRHGDRMQIFDRQQNTSNCATIFVSNITNQQPGEYVQKLAMFSDPNNNIQCCIYGRCHDSHQEYEKSVDLPAGVGAVNSQRREFPCSSKAGHRSNLASLRFCVDTATERCKHTHVDFLWITRRFRTIAAFSDKLGALGRRRIHVHVTGDKTQE